MTKAELDEYRQRANNSEPLLADEYRPLIEEVERLRGWLERIECQVSDEPDVLRGDACLALEGKAPR